MTNHDVAVREPVGGGSLRNGLAILELFSEQEPSLTVGEIARRVGLHKSTASRIAATLNETGYLESAGATGRYRLGPKPLRLAAAVPSARSLTELAAPIIRGVVADTGETGHLAVLDGGEVLTVFVADGWRSIRMHATVGKRAPAHASAAGKAMLTGLSAQEIRRRLGSGTLEPRTEHTVRSADELDEALRAVRSRGIALDDEELEVGLRCVAAAILDPVGQPVAAVALSGPTQRVSGEWWRTLEVSVKRAARQISEALGADPRSW